MSRDGVIPISFTQDEAGPIVRTVEDAARMLDVIAGYDPADPITAFSTGKIPPSYTESLDPNGLEGARIGLVLDLVGQDVIHEEVNAVVEDAIATMTEAGATVVRIRIPNFADLTRGIALSGFEFKIAFNRYLTSLGPGAPVGSLEEFIERGEFHPSLRGGLEANQNVQNGLADPEYRSRLLRREELRQAVMTVIADNELDAVLYPHQRRLVAPIGEGQLERNGVLSNSTGFPAITLSRRFFSIDGIGPAGCSHRYRAARPRLERAYADQTRVRFRTGRAHTAAPDEHAAAALKDWPGRRRFRALLTSVRVVPLGQLDADTRWVGEVGDLELEVGDLAVLRVELDALRLELLTERLEVVELEPDVVDRPPAGGGCRLHPLTRVAEAHVLMPGTLVVVWMVPRGRCSSPKT